MSLPLRLSVVAFAAGASLFWHEPRESVGEVVWQESTLTGRWTLSQEKTERPRDQTVGDVEQTGAEAAVGMGGRGGRRGARDNPGSGGGGNRVQFTPAQRALISSLIQPADSLLISQADTSVSIDNGTGMLLNLALNGRAREEPQPDGTTFKSKASRRGTDVIVERDLGTLGSTREIYRLDKTNPRVMTVEFRYEHKRQRRTVDQKRVYEMK